MHDTKLTLSIVIPVYNGALSLPVLAERLSQVLPDLSVQYEVIMVEDGGRDNSWEVIQQLAKKYVWLRGIKMMRNYGQHNALLCGIREAKYDIIITMDDDLEHPPEELHKLLEKLSEGYDVVYGAPMEQQHGLLRDFASQVTKIVLQGSMGADSARNISALRVFRTYLRDAFRSYQSPFVNLDVLLTWGTTRFTFVRVQHDVRQFGVSNYTFRKLVTHAFNMMTGFSTMPLQLASWLGFVMTGFGLVVLIYVIIIRVVLLGSPVPGFAFIASMVAIFSGAQMFALGIIGEYLARMHFRITERPTYVVRHMTDSVDLNDSTSHPQTEDESLPVTK